MINYEDFEKVDIRIGKIVKVEETEGLRIPAYKMTIDFGKELGIKISVGQYTKNYSKKELTGKLMMGVINFKPKKIGGYTSEVLTLGFEDADGGIVMAIPERDVPLGKKMY